jgi:hypothetical protein
MISHGCMGIGIDSFSNQKYYITTGDGGRLVKEAVRMVQFL